MSNETLIVDSRWRVRKKDGLVWAAFDNDFVAFQRQSGKTHFLNEASYRLLTEVLESPKDLDEIAADLGGFDASEATADYMRQLRGILGHLEGNGPDLTVTVTVGGLDRKENHSAAVGAFDSIFGFGVHTF